MHNLTEEKNKTDLWFDDFVSSIRVDQLALETGVASEEQKHLYETLINGNIQDMMDSGMKTAQQYYIQNMLVDYIHLLKKFEEAPFLKLAVSFHNSELLVWAEIEDDAEDVEGKLIMAEAKINAKYHRHGFDMATTIVEKCDMLPVPSHYNFLFGK
ncbi:hypothetical protein MUK70_06280 [Dyadobacter chenwenxiniae]|uniref:Uncharacterized protein n=1 Tax=Dyadobacter chenwenxiniae TaxID=2906456 RepID=A0A9X1PRG2_9BACT|nr:hypothetical protein [Dyadobacter chenwenxiniae]MCF0065135.1 hypothetical protein [Dyadobacter chenwenxiniae]UON84593.1 hypothetical protein MUK70_06280 [Dyadobacter chenwenxiniae]